MDTPARDAVDEVVHDLAGCCLIGSMNVTAASRADIVDDVSNESDLGAAVIAGALEACTTLAAAGDVPSDIVNVVVFDDGIGTGAVDAEAPSNAAVIIRSVDLKAVDGDVGAPVIPCHVVTGSRGGNDFCAPFR